MRLWCVACCRPSGPEARGWRIYLSEDPDDGDEVSLAAYCPACAVREFGDVARQHETSD